MRRSQAIVKKCLKKKCPAKNQGSSVLLAQLTHRVECLKSDVVNSEGPYYLEFIFNTPVKWRVVVGFINLAIFWQISSPLTWIGDNLFSVSITQIIECENPTKSSILGCLLYSIKKKSSFLYQWGVF